jgi:hypothetical protein
MPGGPNGLGPVGTLIGPGSGRDEGGRIFSMDGVVIFFISSLMGSFVMLMAMDGGRDTGSLLMGATGVTDVPIGGFFSSLRPGLESILLGE